MKVMYCYSVIVTHSRSCNNKICFLYVTKGHLLLPLVDITQHLFDNDRYKIKILPIYSVLQYYSCNCGPNYPQLQLPNADYMMSDNIISSFVMYVHIEPVCLNKRLLMGCFSIFWLKRAKGLNIFLVRLTRPKGRGTLEGHTQSFGG